MFTTDITCCSLHIAPGLKGHDFKAFSCSIDSFFMPVRLHNIFKNIPNPNPPLPQEKDDHQFPKNVALGLVFGFHLTLALTPFRRLVTACLS